MIVDPPPPASCACEAWKAADMNWVLLTEAQRQVWRDAVRRPGISGYDMYMSENMHCFHDGDGGPDGPSPSGGYSTVNVVCDAPDGIECPEACLHEEPPPEWSVGEDCCGFDAGTTPSLIFAQGQDGRLVDDFGFPYHEEDAFLMPQVTEMSPEWCYYDQREDEHQYLDLDITPEEPFPGWLFTVDRPCGVLTYWGNPENAQEPPVFIGNVNTDGWWGEDWPREFRFSYI